MKRHDGSRGKSIGKALVAPIVLTWMVFTVGPFASTATAAGEDATGEAASPRLLQWQGQANGLTRIELRAGSGTASVRAVDGDEIRIRLRLKHRRWTNDESWRGAFKWFFDSDYEDEDQLSKAIELKVSRRGDALVVKPLPHGRSRESKIGELWELEVPRRFAVDIRMNSAEVVISDVQGGVDLHLGHGEALVDVPRGELDLEVTVGKIDAVSRQGDMGELSLSSQVGDTQLWLSGNRVRYLKPPGPGSKIEIEGDGVDDLRVRVQVGHASLRVH